MNRLLAYLIHRSDISFRFDNSFLRITRRLVGQSCHTWKLHFIYLLLRIAFNYLEIDVMATTYV